MSIKQNTQARRMAELTRAGKRRGLANLTQPPTDVDDAPSELAVVTSVRANAASKKKTVISDAPNGASVTIPVNPPSPGNGVDVSNVPASTPEDTLDANVDMPLDSVTINEPSTQERIDSLLKELFATVANDDAALTYLSHQVTTLPESPFTSDFQVADTDDSPTVDVVEEIEATMTLAADTILSLRSIVEADAKANVPVLLAALETLGARLHQEWNTLGDFVEDALEAMNQDATTFALPVIQTGSISTCPGMYRVMEGVRYAGCTGVSQAEYDSAPQKHGYRLGLKDGVPVWLKM